VLDIELQPKAKNKPDLTTILKERIPISGVSLDKFALNEDKRLMKVKLSNSLIDKKSFKQ